MDLFEEVKQAVVEKYYAKPKGACHDFSHTERVLKNAELLCEKEKADWEIVRYAVLYSDVVRESEHEKGFADAAVAADLAVKDLTGKLSEDKVKAVADAIRTHSRRSKEKPVTIEAKIVYDADKIDAYGELGVTRFLMQGEDLGWSIQQTLEVYVRDGSKLLDSRNFAFTSAGRAMAEPLAREGLEFCKRVLARLG